MTFDQWAETIPSMNNIERVIARIAWNAAIGTATDSCRAIVSECADEHDNNGCAAASACAGAVSRCAT